MPRREPDVDVAVVGGGAAGIYVAHELIRARPDWSIAIFERTGRLGGRLRSVAVPGLHHPIELGGMRYMSSHVRASDVVKEFGIATHPFGVGVGPDRFVLRGVASNGAADPSAGTAYALAGDERGRSAGDLLVAAFERIVPGATRLDEAGWVRARRNHVHQGRPLTDWSMGDALASVVSPDAQRFITDAFGYDSGLRVKNAGDSIPYMLGAGSPHATAVTPNDGMERLTRELGASFETRGGSVRLGHEVTALDRAHGGLRLQFAGGPAISTRRVVLALTVPALRLLAATSPVLQTPAIGAILDSVELVPAVKLYLWYDTPWWLGDFTGGRITTDLPSRKLFYFANGPASPAALLATYTDLRHSEPWAALAGSRTNGSPAPQPMLEAATGYLRELHPSVATIPDPVGSAFSSWGADAQEIGWHFWRAGARSDDVIAATPQVDPALPIHICGEAFSRAQAWVEGALVSGANVVERILAVAR